MTMVNVIAVEEILREYLETARDPFLNSMKNLPATVFDELVHEFVKSAECDFDEDSLSLKFDIKRFKRRVRAAIRREIMDEVGLLIKYGASKSVISEVTGMVQSKVKDKRRQMELDHPKQGRPRNLDPAQIELITSIWNKSEGTKSVRLIQTHEYSKCSIEDGKISINDVWLIVKEIKSVPIIKENGRVRQCN